LAGKPNNELVGRTVELREMVEVFIDFLCTRMWKIGKDGGKMKKIEESGGQNGGMTKTKEDGEGGGRQKKMDEEDWEGLA